MTNGKAVTNLDIYDRLERLRIEVTRKIDETSRDHKADISNLQQQFTTLEAGRLTRAEGNINELRVEIQKAINKFDMGIDTVRSAGSTLNAKFVIIGAIAMIVLSGISAAIFYRLIVK